MTFLTAFYAKMNWFHILWLHSWYVTFLYCLMWLQYNQGSIPSWMAGKERERETDRETERSERRCRYLQPTLALLLMFTSSAWGSGLFIKKIYNWRCPKCPLMLISQSCICKGNKMGFKETKRKKMEWPRGRGSSTSSAAMHLSRINL